MADAPAREQLGDLGPFVAQPGVGLEDDVVLLRGPGRLFDAGVEVVVPALAALLSDAALEVARDEGPALWAVLVDKLDDQVVLLRGVGGGRERWGEGKGVSNARRSSQCKTSAQHLCWRRDRNSAPSHRLQAYAPPLQHRLWGEKRTSLVQGPLTRSGLRTFCQRWRHCTSSRPSKSCATRFQFLPLKVRTACGLRARASREHVGQEGGGEDGEKGEEGGRKGK